MSRIGDAGGAHRTLTAAGLARLLQRLDPDPDEAAREFERLRRTLVRFFEWRGGWPADECADATVDRLARRLEEETDIGDVRQYARGIARLVLLEWRRRPAAALDDDADLSRIAAPLPEEPDSLRDCFDRCLGELPGDARSLLLAYYQGERAVKIANRRRIAASLDLSDNALRSRIQRLRERLEQCIDGCLSQSL